MKTLILAAIRCSLMLLVPSVTYAINAQWDLDPISGDWNTADNWTPNGVPNDPADTATFGPSNRTAVSNSANTIVDGITFAPGASSFTITASSGLTLTLNGVGITNDSGTRQNFVAAPSGARTNALRLLFKNSATAGSGTFFTMNGGATIDGSPGFTNFDDSSSASHGTFTNNGPTVQDTFGGAATLFHNSATASNGTFINNGGTISDQRTVTGGSTSFGDTSTAANGTFINNGGTVSGADGGSTSFSNSSTADNAIITNNGGTASGASGGGTFFGGLFGTTTAGNATIINNGADASGASGGITNVDGFLFSKQFFGSSTADNATIISNGANVSGAGGGETIFSSNSSNPLGKSTAGNATLIANGGTGGGQGGAIFFEGFSTGGTSRVEVFGNGNLDISAHQAPGMRIGSLEGDGNVFLGANNLTVGSNNLSTEFSGVIQDSGSLTKIGDGTLVLTGGNTYTGDTNIIRGILKVDGSITSNVFVRRGSTLAGTGTINGNVTNNRSTVAGTGTINGNVMNNDLGTLRPGGALGAPGVLTVVHNYTQAEFATLMIQIAGANTGQFSVLDVLGNANLNGVLDPVLLNGFVPSIGDSFTFLAYGSLTGEFSRIRHQLFDNGMLQWSVIYEANHAILTVEQHVPDQGSTFLLLSVCLLGLVTYRRQLLRAQP